MTYTFEQWIIFELDDSAVAIHRLLSFNTCLPASFVAVPEHEEQN
jgi:hypothetical protein